jgi:hypothetical protein
MTHTAHRTAAIALALALALAGSAGALAAGPLSGRTYEGGAPSTGVSEGHRKPTHAAGNIILRVSRSGRSVTVRFASSSPVLYCVTQQRVHVQSSHAASIASNGTFKAAVGERFAAGPGAPAIVQLVSGHFSGGTVRGTVHTRAGECSGVANFSATAR